MSVVVLMVSAVTLLRAHGITAGNRKASKPSVKGVRVLLSLTLGVVLRLRAPVLFSIDER